jgi:signal peptidase I
MSAKSWRLIVRWSIRLLLLAVLGLIAASVVILTVLPRATHGAALDVLSGSMTPGIPVGSIVIDRPVDPGTLRVGDIATYAVPGEHRFITHRIVKIDTSKSPTMFTFKGDANRGPDTEAIPADAIRGKVWFHVPYLGTIRDALHTKGGLAGVAMLLLGGYALYQGAAGLRERRRPQRNTADNLIIDLDRAQPQISVLMRLRRDAFGGLEPASVAQALGVVLVESDEDTFTVLAAHADRARDALELIDALDSRVPAPTKAIAPELPFEPDWNPHVPDHLGVLVAI